MAKKVDIFTRLSQLRDQNLGATEIATTLNKERYKTRKGTKITAAWIYSHSASKTTVAQKRKTTTTEPSYNQATSNNNRLIRRITSSTDFSAQEKLDLINKIVAQ
jgi:hypothetical protein